MEDIIKKAKFCHDDEDEYDRFDTELEDRRNSEGITFKEVQAALKALSLAFSGKPTPVYESRGWDQARKAFDHIDSAFRDLVNDDKTTEAKRQEEYFGFIVTLASDKVTAIHMQLVKDAARFDVEEYAQTLPNEKIRPLVDAVCVHVELAEKGIQSKDFYEQYRYYVNSIVKDILSENQVQAFKEKFLELAVHLELDYSHVDEEGLSDIMNAHSSILSQLEDPWKEVKDIPFIKAQLSKYINHFKKSQAIIRAQKRPIGESIEKLAETMGERGLAEELALDFHDLAVTIAQHKQADEDFLIRSFRRTLEFFKKLPEKSIQNKPTLFKGLVKKFEEGISNMDIKFLEERYAKVISKTLKLMCSGNKDLVEIYLPLIVHLLKRPNRTLIDAAADVADAEKGMGWKGRQELAQEIFKALSTLQMPNDLNEDDKEKFLSDLSSFMNKFMDGLKRGKILTNFGPEVLQMVANYLQMEYDFEPIHRLVEEMCEHMELNQKNERTVPAVIEAMEVVLKMSSDMSYPWLEDNWLFERATKELVRLCRRSITDPRLLGDKGLAVFVSVCEECLKHDVLNPVTGEFCSTHFTIFIEIMEKLSNWMKDLDKFELAKNMIGPLIDAYSTEDPLVYVVNRGHFIIICQAPSGLKLIAPHLDRLFTVFIECEDNNLLHALTEALPANPKVLEKHMEAIMRKFQDTNDAEMINYTVMLLQKASTKVPGVFTKEHTKILLDKSGKDMSRQSTILHLLSELSKRRPEIMVDHVKVLMDKKRWDSGLAAFINDMVATLAIYDQGIAPQVLNYLLEAAVVPEAESSCILTSLNSARQVGFKYPDLIKERRSQVEQMKFNDMNCLTLQKSILDMIDGKTSDEVMKQLEEQQTSIVELRGKVDETEATVSNMKEDLSRQDEDLKTVKKDVNLHGHRLDKVEETVDETVAKVEEIDQKTLSHAPYWSRDVSKLLNPASEHDWRLLSSRLDYSNDDIRAWAQQADPCMAMLNEWYATRKTSEATFAILTQLQEMNRQDAAVIVENAMKNAEAVVEDEDFEYASPPPIFISYQWGHQPEARLLQQHLEMAGYQCWLDLGQMGGGDKLFQKIDSGIRAAKVVISCVTEKYAKSPNCNREVNLSVGLNKAMIPLLMEKCTWPPPGSMGPIFSEYLFIRFFQRTGEELPDERYWPKDKFMELLMQLNVLGLPPEETQIQPVYRNWWIPKEQEIKIDKSKTKDGGKAKPASTPEQDKKAAESPDVFISYQWGKQKNIIQLYERLTALGLSCWLDIKQMGGGDSLYDKIDRGVRGCKVVVSCVTTKYALSANCRREVSLADALKKPLLPLLLESMTWPPSGPMSMAFTQLLYIDFTKDESEQMTWDGVKSEELLGKIHEYVPSFEPPENRGPKGPETATNPLKEPAPKVKAALAAVSKTNKAQQQQQQEKEPPLVQHRPEQAQQKQPEKQECSPPPASNPAPQGPKPSKSCDIL